MEAANVPMLVLLLWASLAVLTKTPGGTIRLAELSNPMANLVEKSNLILLKPYIPGKHCEKVTTIA